MKKLLLGGITLLLLCSCQPLMPLAAPGINRQLESKIAIKDNTTVYFLVVTDVTKGDIVEDINTLQKLQAEQNNDIDGKITP